MRLPCGYVHFVLGNHEIMNLSGDLNYVQQKYKENATLLKLPYQTLYDENSELGRWLRTKNIVEKIGNLLFAHGGISPEVNRLNLSLDQINYLARPYYAGIKKAGRPADTTIKILYDGYSSPFWYRNYYKKDHYSVTNKHLYYKATNGQIDSTLNKFSVKHIVTGHTIVSDKVTVHYDGRIINTDTKHAEGKSEALLIEGNNFYRVNAEGKRVLLFRDEEK